MWRSSSSNGQSPGRGPARGFTLLEAMVSLLILIMVLIVAMTMLFQMRAFAERQQYFMLPRQAARRATDYLSYYFAGASDANYVDAARPSPNALIMYYNLNGVVTQASYNNLTGDPVAEPGNAPRVVPANPPLIPAPIASTNFGDVGTDIVTMVAPVDPSRYLVAPPFPALGPNVDLFFNFRVGCATDDAFNLTKFQAATGFDGTQSALLMLVDGRGSWSYVRIPKLGYGASNCADLTNFKNIKVTVDTVSATLPAPPNGAAGLTDPVYLVAGLQMISFRVLTDRVDGVPKLQQKLGLFDPNKDNPGTDFTNVLENVEDLQVAYMYSQDAAVGAKGLVWNTKAQTIDSAAPGCAGLPPPACDTHVPFQAGPNFAAAPPPLDISNVIGVRFSVTGRSPLLPLAAQKVTNVGAGGPLAAIPSQTANQHFRPASEDHAVTLSAGVPNYDQFDHYRASATLMLRSRTPKG